MWAKNMMGNGDEAFMAQMGGVVIHGKVSYCLFFLVSICSKNTGLQGSNLSSHRMTTGFGPFELSTRGLDSIPTFNVSQINLCQLLLRATLKVRPGSCLSLLLEWTILTASKFQKIQSLSTGYLPLVPTEKVSCMFSPNVTFSQMFSICMLHHHHICSEGCTLHPCGCNMTCAGGYERTGFIYKQDHLIATTRSDQ